MQNIRIGSREIGQGQPCYVIAEAGINHNGKIELAKKLIDKAVEAGADSVKFQMFKTGKLLSKKVVEGQHIKLAGGEDSAVFDAIKKVELTQEMCRKAFDYAKEKGVELVLVDGFESITGAGVKGEVSSKAVLLGKQKFLEDNGIMLSEELKKNSDRLQEKAETVIWIAVDSQAVGMLGISDPVKQTTPGAIIALHKMGLKVVMLTGDNEKTAKAIAKELGITDVYAGLEPKDKQQIVKKLRSEGAKVLMAGDGINDAPALSEAEVGVAMGTGTDVAIESAGITLVKGDLNGIVKALRLSREVMRNIRQNLFFAFIYNAIGVPIAAGILYPFLGLLLNPMIAGAAMSFSSVSVIGNSLRLRNIKL